MAFTETQRKYLESSGTATELEKIYKNLDDLLNLNFVEVLFTLKERVQFESAIQLFKMKADAFREEAEELLMISRREREAQNE